MRQSTSNPTQHGSASTAASPLVTGGGGWSTAGDAGGLIWSDEAKTERRWIIAASGLGILACPAIAGAAARSLSPAWPCDTATQCNELGAHHAQAPDAEPEALALAARLFKRACDQGHAPACNNLGLAYQRAEGVPQDYGRAMTSFERACSGGFAEGCSNQGALYEHGLGVAVNVGDAQRLYSQACRRGSALGCSNLGVLFKEGRGMTPDSEAAARLFAEACRAGSPVGCSNLFLSEPPAAGRDSTPEP
jgi:TPR repeat protein